MSYTNGFQTLVQSMNGLLTFNDGAGTVIENGTITTQKLSLNSILANLPISVVNLWTNFTTGTANLLTSMTSGTINMATSGVNIVIGSFTFYQQSIQNGTTGSLSLFDQFQTGSIDLCSGILSGDLFIGNKSNVTINGSATTETTKIAYNTAVGVLITIGSSVNTNLLGAVEIIGSQINSRVKTVNLQIGNSLTTGIVQIASSIISVVVGSFTFLGTTIQAGTSGTFDFFTNVTASSTVNLFSNMTSGTFNIGKGGNINLGTATTGSLIKIDQNGLDTQVIIAPQQTSLGTVKIGNTANSNQIGSIFIKDNDISTTSGVNGTFTLIGTQQLGYTNYARTFPAYISNFAFVTTPTFSVSQNFVTGGSFQRIYDVRQFISTDGLRTADGQGNLLTNLKTQQFSFNSQSLIPPATPSSTTLTMGYYNTGDDAVYISGGAPYGGVSIGGCGVSNPSYSTAYQRAMTIYPHYGLRLYTGGLSFDKGDLTSSFGGGRGFFIQSGLFVAPTSVTLASQTNVTYNVPFTTTFNTVGPRPFVICTHRASSSNAFLVSSNSFNANFDAVVRNVSNFSVTTTISFYWIAIGPY